MKEQFDLYFAGWYSQGMEERIFKNNFNQLLSFVNELKHIEKYIQAKKDGWTGKLMIDSGAFSVHKSGKVADVEAYIKWINENHEYLDYYIQLDDIPGKWGTPRTKEELEASPPKTWENYLYMRSKVADREKLLPVFHQGEDFKYLEQFLEYKDEENNERINYICISSNKELSAKARMEWYRTCFEVIAKSSNPNIKTHSLGTQSEKHCEMLPFTSVDATSWIMTAANGNVYTKWGPVTISERQLTGKHHIKNKASYEVFREYIKSNGFDPDKMKTDNDERIAWNMKYLGDWARDKREHKGPKNMNRGRLF